MRSESRRRRCGGECKLRTVTVSDHHELDAWEQPEPAEFRWTDGLPWAVFLAIAWLVFELTAQPALTAGAFCLKFAWKDSVVGFWLWRSDPRRARGLSCLLFYLASAGWKAMVAGILVAVLVKFIAAAAGGPPGPVHEMTVAMLVAGAGFAACCGIGVLGIVVAWRGRVRVWLDSNVYWSYRDGVWPPTTCGVENRIRRVLIVTQLVGLLFGTIGLIALVSPVFNLAGGGPAGSFMIGGIVVVALLVLWLPERINARIAARFPDECWPDSIAGSVE